MAQGIYCSSCGRNYTEFRLSLPDLRRPEHSLFRMARQNVAAELDLITDLQRGFY